MNTQEQQQAMILNRFSKNISVRQKLQVQRLVAAYRKEGVVALVHGNRGRAGVARSRNGL